LTVATTFAQGLLVDQASGTLNEVPTQSTILPTISTVQSFTPSLSAVGFIQLSTSIEAASSGETVMINLRQNAYNGPIVDSTTPIFLVNKTTQISTFYFPVNVPVTPNQLYYFEPIVLAGGIWYVGDKAPSTYNRGDLFSNGVPSGGAGVLWFREGTVVPEPGAAWLVLLGGIAFVCHCRSVKRS
jgi:hypothetical protein